MSHSVISGSDRSFIETDRESCAAFMGVLRLDGAVLPGDDRAAERKADADARLG